MLIVGEKINILNPVVYDALEREEVSTIVSLAKRQVKAGAQALDINLGPCKKVDRLIPLVITSIQDSVNVPLFLYARVLSLPDVIKIHKGRATINGVTCDQDQLAHGMNIAKEYDANLVVFLTKKGLEHATAEEYCELTEIVFEQADKTGIPIKRLFLDPMFGCRPDPIALEASGGFPDITGFLESIELLRELRSEHVQIITGLSNASCFVRSGQRSSLHQTLIRLLAKENLSAVILNPLDRELMTVIEEVKECGTGFLGSNTRSGALGISLSE